MKIYTKTGDKGHTQVYADKVLRVAKSDELLECYGSLDELNAHLGLLISLLGEAPTSNHFDEHKADLCHIQQLLFQIGFAISASTTLVPADVLSLEQKIDQMQTQLAPQTSFILPGGSQAAAQAHVCRTIARRAERRMVALLAEHEVPTVCLEYLNRLSDYLFVFARWQNNQQGLEDIKV